MALYTCPCCGGQITDRMDICPHCRAILRQPSAPAPITKEQLSISAKSSIFGALTALGFTILLLLLWNGLSTVMGGRFIGESALAAVQGANMVFFARVFALLPAGAALFCALAVFLRGHSPADFLGSVILFLLFAVIGYATQSIYVMRSNIEPYAVDMARQLSLAYGAAFPLTLGGLALLSLDRTFKKALCLQLIGTGAWFVISVLLQLFLIAVMRFGVLSFTLGTLVSSLLLFAAGALSSKSFRSLISPR